MEVYGGENVELGIRVSKVSHPEGLAQLPKRGMNLGGGEMGLRVAECLSLMLLHVCDRAAWGQDRDTGGDLWNLQEEKDLRTCFG